MVMNVGMQRAILEKDLERKGIDSDKVDLHALINPTLTLPENRENIVRKTRTNYPQERVDVAFCEYLDDECLKGQHEACTEACKECRTHCNGRDKGKGTRKKPIKKFKTKPKPKEFKTKPKVKKWKKKPGFWDFLDDIL